jgi:hypothetical protein
MLSEQHIQQTILIRLARGAVRLFRNNVGVGWAGPSTKVTAGNVAAVRAGLRPGDVVVRNGRPLRAGLAVGSSDLIGLRSVTVTPEMVGQKLAVFAAVEVKAPRRPLTAEQEAFIAMVVEMGGFAGLARSVEEAEGVLRLGR